MKFKCQESCGGKCCVSPNEKNFIFLTQEDMQRLEDFLRIPPLEFAEGNYFDSTRFAQYKKPKFLWFMRDSVGKACRFLKAGKCSVYEARPTQCRTFPFWPELDWEKVRETCPGIGVGEKLTKETIRGKFREQEIADRDYSPYNT
jgi:uncharacterized protein